MTYSCYLTLDTVFLTPEDSKSADTELTGGGLKVKAQHLLSHTECNKLK